MTAIAISPLSAFALDVAEGLGAPDQKYLPARYFYDDLGSTLFEAITLLPEYGLTRADERLLRAHSRDIANATGRVQCVAELGSGSGKKTHSVLRSLSVLQQEVHYCPIDVSAAALEACRRELSDVACVDPVCDDWMSGLARISRSGSEPMLVMFLGSSIGNLQRQHVIPFLSEIRSRLNTGDFLLLGADLVKNVEQMLSAYDDPTGVTAAFNLNLLGRMNRELDANFDLRTFAHEVRWNEPQRRIEMHLLSGARQSVRVGALDRVYEFAAGETIWTESSHKFSKEELARCANASGFSSIATWVDEEWPFAETLWQAV